MQVTKVSYVPYPSKKMDNNDWVAVLKVNPQNFNEMPNEEMGIVSKVNVPFHV